MEETAFLNYFRSTKDRSRISFGHNFPGTIIPIDVSSESIVCQKRAFLCSTENVDLDITFQRRISAGFFGGEGFKNMLFGGEGLFLTTLTGPGKVWIQTTPIQSLAAEISPYLRNSSSSK